MSYEYNKAMKKGRKESTSSKNKKPYVWAKLLSFLDVGPSERRCRNLEEYGNSVTFGDDSCHAETPSVHDEDDSETDATPAAQLPKSKNSKDTTRRNLKRHSAGRASEEDLGRMYLISMLHDYKELSSDEKLEFKHMNLQFFRDLRRKKQLQSHGSSADHDQQRQCCVPDTPNQRKPSENVRHINTQTLPDQSDKIDPSSSPASSCSHPQSRFSDNDEYNILIGRLSERDS